MNSVITEQMGGASGGGGKGVVSTSSSLPDTQNLSDHRRIPIRKVGVRALEVPIKLQLGRDFQQNSIARLALSVSLDAAVKGTHMSRFVELLSENGETWDLLNLRSVLEGLNAKLPSEAVHVEIECPIFMNKPAPVSGKTGPMKYHFRAEATLSGGDFSQTNALRAWVTTLCPCSKAISEFSAHNQRGEVTLTFTAARPVPLASLIGDIETAASSPLYSLLKRVDEKAVTEQAYQNPVFVEDLVRNIAERLAERGDLTWFEVEAENFESIHLHNAYAMLSSHDIM
jgi:GTP cyclohydrolase I